MRPLRADVRSGLGNLRASWRAMTRLRRAAAVSIGVLVGTGFGLPIADLSFAPVLAGIVGAVTIGALVRWLVPAPHREAVGLIVSLGFALRLALSAAIYTAAVLAGREGFITGDDKGYAELAWAVAQYWRGTPDPAYQPPDWGGGAYFLGFFTYYESVLFYVFGRQVQMAEFLNAGYAAATLVLVFDLARRVFGVRAGFAALAVTAFFPSLVLWSVLNLKDALVLLLVAVAFSLLLRFQTRPYWLTLAAVFALLVPIHGLRATVFFAVAAAVPPAVAVMTRATRGRRAAWTTAATVVTLAMMVNYGLLDLLPATFRTSEGVRQGMAQGARTSFVDAPPAAVGIGDTFIVVDPNAALAGQGIPASTATPAPRPTPPRTPTTHYVQSDTRIVLTTTPRPSAAGEVYAQAGDIVVVGPPGTTARPGPPTSLNLTDVRGSAPSVRLMTWADRETGVAQRTLEHIPRGIAYVLLAPFPWDVERTADVPVVIDMFAWYAVLAAAVTTIFRTRRPWRAYLPLVLYVGAVLTVYVLIQGNLGILFRHRSMIVPFSIVLAAPTFAAWAAWAARPRPGAALSASAPPVRSREAL